MTETPTKELKKEKTFKGTLREKLKNLIEKGNEKVEIVTEKETVSGVVHEVGKDYVSIVRVVEQEETQKNIDQNNKEEKQKVVLILELEILIRLQDIISISRILRSSYR